MCTKAEREIGAERDYVRRGTDSLLTRVARFFFAQLTNTGKYIPNNQQIYQIAICKIYQMAVK
jgi:hypothetical protein